MHARRQEGAYIWMHACSMDMDMDACTQTVWYMTPSSQCVSCTRTYVHGVHSRACMSSVSRIRTYSDSRFVFCFLLNFIATVDRKRLGNKVGLHATEKEPKEREPGPGRQLCAGRTRHVMDADGTVDAAEGLAKRRGCRAGPAKSEALCQTLK